MHTNIDGLGAIQTCNLCICSIYDNAYSELHGLMGSGVTIIVFTDYISGVRISQSV
jgi:hypothetical protein